MKTLEFKANKEQSKNIESLAYWIADLNYMIERYGIDEPEIKRVKDTISFVFDLLDRSKVPFWVQNTVIAFSENWRAYKDSYLDIELKKKNIYIV